MSFLGQAGGVERAYGQRNDSIQPPNEQSIYTLALGQGDGCLPAFRDSMQKGTLRWPVYGWQTCQRGGGGG